MIDDSSFEDSTGKNGSQNRRGTKGSNIKKQYSDKSDEGKSSDEFVCLREPQRARGKRDKLKYFRAYPDAEKKQLFEQYARERNIDGSAYNTRSRNPSSVLCESKGKPTTGHVLMRGLSPFPLSPSYPVLLWDDRASLEATIRCDDTSEGSLASPAFAEAAVIKGIGRITAIQHVTIRLALQQSADAHFFRFSRAWGGPRTILQLGSGQPVLENTSFLASEESLAAEVIPIVRPVFVLFRTDFT